MKSKLTKDLMNYLNNCVSPYHTVLESAEILEKAGFQKLSYAEDINNKQIEAGGAYYTIPFPSTLLAFTVGKDIKADAGVRIAVAHTDFPCLHVKPIAELSGAYKKINIEVYGGPILNTWLDRPLSLAGRVMLRSEDVYNPRMEWLNIKKPVLTIPNLAIHMNREVNKGIELKKQNDMIPILGNKSDADDTKDYFLKFISKQLKCNKEDILDFDLYVYNCEEATTIGMDEEFLSSPRIDNLTSCHAALSGLINGRRESGVNIIALYDNEEIGSRTKQGADSMLLSMCIERIYKALEKTESMYADIHNGFLLSIDVAHAIHPAHPEKYDSVNNMAMNEGVTLKLSINQRYSYDSEAVAILQQLCDKHDIKYKKFVNNADVAGGGTMGPMLSSLLPMKTVDIGVPILAMHSARELMGAYDQAELEKLTVALFSE